MAACGADVVEAGIGKASNVPGAVASEDDHAGLLDGAADGNPLEAVDAREEVGDGHQHVGGGHVADPGEGTRPLEIFEAVEGFGEEGKPGPEVFAADDAAHEVLVGPAGEPLVGVQILLAARALEGGRVGAYAKQEGRCQRGAGAQAQEPEVAGQDGRGCPAYGADVQEGRLVGGDLLGSRRRVVVDDDVEGDAGKELVVVRLAIDDGEVGVVRLHLGLPFLDVEPQVPDHRQIVGPGYLVDAADVHPARALGEDALERHGGGHGVGVGAYENAPALILGYPFEPEGEAVARSLYGCGGRSSCQHDGKGCGGFACRHGVHSPCAARRSSVRTG